MEVMDVVESGEMKFPAAGFDNFNSLVGVKNFAETVKLSLAPQCAGFFKNHKIAPVEINPAPQHQTVEPGTLHRFRRIIIVALEERDFLQIGHNQLHKINTLKNNGAIKRSV